ncbi:MAG: hypothetical protein ABI353_11515 [Isosphaeraceae bacterium]
MLTSIVFALAMSGQFAVTPAPADFTVTTAPRPSNPAVDAIMLNAWRAALAAKPKAKAKTKPKAAPRRWSWRVPSDNHAIEVYSADGKTYTHWRYRAGYAPQVQVQTYSYGYSYGGAAYCPPGGT